MENQDSICFIDKVLAVEDIAGADKIQLGIIAGWKSIIPKDTIKPGDIVLCLTTDAVIPEDFGQKHNILTYLRRGNRVRTVKLRGVYSDCIIMPLSDILDEVPKANKLNLGSDLMDVLKIYKYQEPEITVTLPGGRRIKQKDNPNFNKYYKFPNYKNVPNIFSEEDDVVITRKIHGSNARYGIVKKSKLSIIDRIKKFFGNEWVGYEYVYGSHNVIKGSDTNGFYSTDVWKTVGDRYEVKRRLWEMVNKMDKAQLGRGIILYGEVYGPGIQGEKYSYGKKEIELAFFDVELNGEYLPDFPFTRILEELDLPVVPYLYKGYFNKEIVDKFVNNQFIDKTNIPHEGVVVKKTTGERQKVAKFINPDYLIFSEKHVVPEGH